VSIYAENGPVREYFYKNGMLNLREWHKNNDMHRDDGPAREWFREDGSLCLREWYQNNRLTHVIVYDNMTMIVATWQQGK
jgi:hypothetical protein